MNRQIKVIDAENNTAKIYYNAAGQEIKTVDPLNNQAQIVYDERANKIALIDGEGNILFTKYDILAKKTEEYDLRGVIHLDEYTGDITEDTETVTILGQEYVLDKAYMTEHIYDTLGREIETIGTMGNSTTVEYDNVGNKKRVVNGDQTVDYQYTDLYFVEEEIVNKDTDNERITQYTHDKVGNVLTVTDPRGKTTTKEYDDLYRLITLKRPDGSMVEYQ